MPHDLANPLRPLGDTTLTFNGTTDFRSVANDPAFNYPRAQDFTVAAWIRAEARQAMLAKPDNDMIEKWSGTGGYPFVLRFQNETAGQTAGRVVAARWDGKVNPSVRSGSRIDDGADHHVAFVRRTVNGEAQLHLFIDGKREASSKDTTTGETTNDSPLFLGRRGVSGLNFFMGAIRGLRLHSVGLTDEQIQKLAESPLTFRDFEPNVPIDATLPPDYNPFADDWCCLDAGGRRYWLEKRSNNAWYLHTDSSGAPRAYGPIKIQHARLEINDRPARPERPPAILLMDEPSKRLQVLLPERDQTGALSLGTPIEVAKDSLLSPVHSGGGNSVLSRIPGDDDLVLVAYPSSTTPAGGVGTDQYVAVVSRGQRRLLHTHLVGNTGRGADRDGHDIPAITTDSAGRLHVVLGGHHAPLNYRNIAAAELRADPWSALSPVISVGATPSSPQNGHTYIALVCDGRDRLHVVTRWSGDRYKFKLVYNRREADGRWAGQQSLVDPTRAMYMCWYNRLLLEGDRLVLVSPGPLWGQLSSLPGSSEPSNYRLRWPGEVPDDAPGYPASKDNFFRTQQNHPRFTLVSEDGGDTWSSRVLDESPLPLVLEARYAGDAGADSVDLRAPLQLILNAGWAGVRVDDKHLLKLETTSDRSLSVRYTVGGVERQAVVSQGGYFTIFAPHDARTIKVIAASYGSTLPSYEVSEDVTARVQALVADGHTRLRVRNHALNVTRPELGRNVPKRLVVEYTIDGGPARTQVVDEHRWLVFGAPRDQVATLGPVGGAATTTRDDWPAARFFGAITEVSVRHGEIVDALQVAYSGRTLARHGGAGGTVSVASFSADDPLVEISGSHGTYYGATNLLQLTLKSRSGKVHGPYGQGGGAPFQFKTGAQGQIVAFIVGELLRPYGDNFLSSIGVHTLGG